MTPDLFVQIFSWHRVVRDIWTDGRTLPKDFNPDVRRWYGYSAGRWEGNTLVVDTAGFDARAWLDQNGYPISEQMRLEERYTRINHDTIELKMTVTDPVMYTMPWVAETKDVPANSKGRSARLVREDDRPQGTVRLDGRNMRAGRRGR